MNKGKANTRFSRLASSVDEMAKALLVISNDEWLVVPLQRAFSKYEDAVRAAKKWLRKREKWTN